MKRKTKIHPSEQASVYAAIHQLAQDSIADMVTLCRNPNRHQDDPIRIMVALSVTLGNDRVVDQARTVWDPPTLFEVTEKGKAALAKENDDQR